MYKILFFISIILSCTSCTLSNKDIKNHWWKLGERRVSTFDCDSIRNSQHVDVLSFDKPSYYRLSGDTIYYDTVPYAEIITRFSRESIRIEIVQFETKDTLLYFGK